MAVETQTSPKALRRVIRGAAPHWVGDGFPVRTLFDYGAGAELSPFLLLDYAAPREFAPADARRGVGAHPHRGFETVTLVYQGEVEHRDSSGGGGRIGAGDVQWMTAASGIVHEEFHGGSLARNGGVFEVAQLWVNLPAAHKSAPPAYQSLRAADIPVVDLGNGRARLVAGALDGRRGPAQTFSPMSVLDLNLQPGSGELPVPGGWNAVLAVLRGKLRLGDGTDIGTAQTGLFEGRGEHIAWEALEDTRALLLIGAPLNEPVIGHGPFVMNTRAEILQAFEDYQNGRMGNLG